MGFADAALEGLDDVISHAKEWARGHEVELCQDLARDTRFTAKKSAKKARAKLVRKLGNQGYTVNKPLDPFPWATSQGIRMDYRPAVP